MNTINLIKYSRYNVFVQNCTQANDYLASYYTRICTIIPSYVNKTLTVK